jgi:hypothetical protein
LAAERQTIYESMKKIDHVLQPKARSISSTDFVEMNFLSIFRRLL